MLHNKFFVINSVTNSCNIGKPMTTPISERRLANAILRSSAGKNLDIQAQPMGMADIEVLA